MPGPVRPLKIGNHESKTKGLEDGGEVGDVKAMSTWLNRAGVVLDRSQ